MANVNRRDDPRPIAPSEVPGHDENEELTSWVRWWHWLVVAAIFIGLFLYYPVWRFEQRWRQVEVGDSIERVKELLGDLGDPSYTVEGRIGGTDGFVYTRYWKSYEVQISQSTRKVISKSIIVGSGASTPPAAAK